MLLFDRLLLDGVRRTKDGYLVASVKAARTGIQLYTGDEVGKPDMKTVRVYRPEAEVFSKDSLASYAHRPVTLDHPPEMVTAANWKKYAVGQTGDEVARDGQFVRVPMVVMDAHAIGAIESKTKREISMGYDCDLDFTPGLSPEGEAYDAVQSNIRINHHAVVDAARGGPELHVGDRTHQTGEPVMSLKKVVVDGITIEVTDNGAEVIEKLQKQLSDALAAKTGLEAKLATDTAAHTTLIATKDAEITTLKKQVTDSAITPAKLRDAAKAHMTTVAQAKAIAPAVKIEDAMDTAAIKKAVVQAKLGDAAKDWTDAQIETSFHTLAANLPKGAMQQQDALRDAMIDGVTQTADTTDADKAHDEMVKGMEDAWKGPKKAA